MHLLQAFAKGLDYSVKKKKKKGWTLSRSTQEAVGANPDQANAATSLSTVEEMQPSN